MKFRFGLLPRVVLAIGLGVGCGFFFPEWATRIALTFNDIFGQFLSFVIPLLILGLVAPGIAEALLATAIGLGVVKHGAAHVAERRLDGSHGAAQAHQQVAAVAAA